MNKAVKKTCKTDADRDEMGKKLGCFNKLSKEIGDEYKELAKKYQRAIHLTDSKQKIPSACCCYFQTMKNLLEIGSRKCTREQVEYLKFFMESFSADVLDLLCAGLTLDGEKCRSLVLPHVNVTHGMPDNDSFFPALIVLLNGL